MESVKFICKIFSKFLAKQLRQIAEFRKSNWECLKDLMPEQVKIPFTEGNVVNVLTGKDHKNRRILIVKNGKDWDPAFVPADTLFRIFYLSKHYEFLCIHKN